MGEKIITPKRIPSSFIAINKILKKKKKEKKKALASLSLSLSKLDTQVASHGEACDDDVKKGHSDHVFTWV
jgi:hypothetical protein